MKLLLKLPSLAAVTLALAAAAPASAVVLAEYTAGTITGNPAAIIGQSFTVGGAGSFTNITFNFFNDFSGTTPVAAGTGFLLSTAYAGTPAGLSGATPGFLGSAVAAGGVYSFGGGVTLTAGVQYFLYANAGTPFTGDSGGGYGGGNLFASIISGGNFSAFSSLDANFRVTGTATGVPDGGPTLLMLALGALGLLFGRRSLRSGVDC